MEATKAQVKLIAPELASIIDGIPQKTRIYISELTDNVVTIDDVEYIYTVQEGDTTAEVLSGLVTILNETVDPIVTVVNVNSNDLYFDVRGVYNDTYTVSTPSLTTVLINAVPSSLWDMFEADIDGIVNINTFVSDIPRAQRYLMAHMLTLNKMSTMSATVSSETVGNVSVTYADPLSDEALGSTKYGMIYRGIYLKQRIIRFV
jgi:hypothetical protein